MFKQSLYLMAPDIRWRCHQIQLLYRELQAGGEEPHKAHYEISAGTRLRFTERQRNSLDVLYYSYLFVKKKTKKKAQLVTFLGCCLRSPHYLFCIATFFSDPQPARPQRPAVRVQSSSALYSKLCFSPPVCQNQRGND